MEKAPVDERVKKTRGKKVEEKREREKANKEQKRKENKNVPVSSQQFQEARSGQSLFCTAALPQPETAGFLVIDCKGAQPQNRDSTLGHFTLSDYDFLDLF